MFPSLHRVPVVLGLALAACSGSDDVRGAPAAKPDGEMAVIDASRLDAGVQSPQDAGSTHASAADAQSPPALAPSRPTRLVLDFTTVPLDGKYSPRNVGAAWVADAQGEWVHTFELWSGPNFQVLAAYFTAGGPNYLPFLGTVTAPPDVITRATQARHAPHPTETWNLLDVNGNEVPDGDYTLVIEVAEQRPEIVYTYPFAKAGKPAQGTAPDTGNLVDVRIRLE